MHYKKTVPAVKSLQPRQKKQMKFRDKEMYYEKPKWDKETFKVSWLTDVLLIRFLILHFNGRDCWKILKLPLLLLKERSFLWKHENGLTLLFELNLDFQNFFSSLEDSAAEVFY